MISEPESAVPPTNGDPPNWRRYKLFGIALAAAAVCVVGISWAVTHQFNRQLSDACGSILTVVNPDGSSFEKLSYDVNSGQGVVRMLYAVNRPGENQQRQSVIICAFGSNRLLAGISPDLVAASVDGKSLGPARIALLNRFWLSKAAQEG
jgi:hypothetical protein